MIDQPKHTKNQTNIQYEKKLMNKQPHKHTKETNKSKTKKQKTRQNKLTNNERNEMKDKLKIEQKKKINDMK